MVRKSAVLFVLLFSIVNTAFAAPLFRPEEEGNPWWLWLIVLAVIALFVAFMIWWWLHESEEEETTTTHAARAGVHDTSRMPDETVDDRVVAVSAAPDETKEIVTDEVPADAETVKIERDAKPDDLTVVEGIGPAIQKILHAAGIHTYRDLGASDPGRIKAILDEANPNLANLSNPTTWPEQAQLAADEKWDELKALKDRLNAGRRA